MTDYRHITGSGFARKSRDDATTYTGPSIAELCQPLSATVMPRSGLIAANGSIMTQQQAMGVQRREVEMKNKR